MPSLSAKDKFKKKEQLRERGYLETEGLSTHAIAAIHREVTPSIRVPKETLEHHLHDKHHSEWTDDELKDARIRRGHPTAALVMADGSGDPLWVEQAHRRELTVLGALKSAIDYERWSMIEGMQKHSVLPEKVDKILLGHSIFMATKVIKG